MSLAPSPERLEDIQEQLPSTVLLQTGHRGFGVFAAAQIRRGSLVGTYGGIVLPNMSMCDQSNTLKLTTAKDSEYVH